MQFKRVTKNATTQVQYVVCPTCASSFRSERVALEHYVDNHIMAPQQIGDISLIKFDSVEEIDAWIEYYDRDDEYYDELVKEPGWYVIVEEEGSYCSNGDPQQFLRSAKDHLHALRRKNEEEALHIKEARKLVGDVEDEY